MMTVELVKVIFFLNDKVRSDECVYSTRNSMCAKLPSILYMKPTCVITFIYILYVLKTCRYGVEYKSTIQVHCIISSICLFQKT
ncbi:hypothetical protein Hanom_Chr09g00858301 [Helianthus anomalus]